MSSNRNRVVGSHSVLTISVDGLPFVEETHVEERGRAWGNSTQKIVWPRTRIHTHTHTYNRSPTVGSLKDAARSVSSRGTGGWWVVEWGGIVAVASGVCMGKRKRRKDDLRERVRARFAVVTLCPTATTTMTRCFYYGLFPSSTNIHLGRLMWWWWWCVCAVDLLLCLLACLRHVCYHDGLLSPLPAFHPLNMDTNDSLVPKTRLWDDRRPNGCGEFSSFSTSFQCRSVVGVFRDGWCCAI